MADTTGQVAIVTGSTRGLGLAIARRLGQAGMRLVVHGRSQESAEAAAATLQAEGFEAVAVGGDAADSATSEALVAKAMAAYGRLDAFVANAGASKDGLVMRTSDEAWLEVVNTDLNGVFYGVRAASKQMMKAKFGRIVIIGSVVGLIGNAGQAAYASAKAGLVGLTKSVAKELATRNVLTNLVAPGYLETDMTKALSPEQREKACGMVPMGRFGEVEEVSGLVHWLIAEGSYVTGQVFVVDGGAAL